MGEESHLHCPGCGSTYYANSAPCVSALVEDAKGRLLLSRRAVEPYLGLWDCPGGFLEEGEHPLDGLRRELEEETGLVAGPARFVGVWMDVYGDAPEAAATLNIYWAVEVDEGEPVAADDVSELRWFRADELPAPDDLAFATVEDALEAWRKGKEPRAYRPHPDTRPGVPGLVRGEGVWGRATRRRGRASARSRPSAARRSPRPRAPRRGTGSAWGWRRRRSAAGARAPGRC